MTKPKTGIVVRDVLHPTIDIFLDDVGKKILLLHLGGYLFSVAYGNR